MSRGWLQVIRSDCSLNICVHFLMIRDHELMIRYGRQNQQMHTQMCKFIVV
jgi:predicted DNA-binding WGR domain protein